MRLSKWIASVAVSIAGVTLLGSAFLPVLCRSRETTNRVKCASNLRQIGQAIDLYARDHNGTLPDSFVTLLRTEDLVPEVFVCPSGNAEAAKSVDAFSNSPTPETCNYTYLGDGIRKSDLTDKVVLAFEDLKDHDSDGINLLFGDGHVEFLVVNRRTPQAWYRELVESTKKPTTRPMVLKVGS